MIQIDNFYNKINKKTYFFGEFIKEWPDFSNYALKALNEKLSTEVNSNNFAIKVIKNGNEKLTVYSLLTELNLNNAYNNIIPENGCNYKIDIKKTTSQIEELSCIVSIPTYEPIEIVFKLRRTEFLITKEDKIKFPDDYFLKGYPILGELVTQSILNNVISFNDHKKQYSDFKQFCLHKIKEQAA